MEGEKSLSTKNEHRPLGVFAALLSGFLLLGTGFLAGWYWQTAALQDPVKIAIVENPPAPVIISALAASDDEVHAGQEAEESDQHCQFVGSKNSDKFHSPDSAPAKRILPENRVCFDSEEEALDAGYSEGTVN